MGYFRDDQPLYELILDEKQQRELDAMWVELDFVASATARMYTQFFSGGRRQARAQTGDEKPEVAADRDGEITSSSASSRWSEGFLAQALEAMSWASRRSRTISAGSTRPSARPRRPGSTPSRATSTRFWISPRKPTGDL